MGLIGGMARTAVVAGTATAVSNRVSRRQAGRWAAQEPQYQEPQYQAPPPPPAPDEDSELIAQLEKLGELRDKGILTDEEFAQQKARLLA
ncbi:MAG: SHOCT domain-containing protein [Nocardioides sp.]